MTVSRKKDTILPEIEQDSFDYAEVFDPGRFFVPAEIYLLEGYFDKNERKLVFTIRL